MSDMAFYDYDSSNYEEGLNEGINAAISTVERLKGKLPQMTNEQYITYRTILEELRHL